MAPSIVVQSNNSLLCSQLFLCNKIANLKKLNIFLLVFLGTFLYIYGNYETGNT